MKGKAWFLLALLLGLSLWGKAGLAEERFFLREANRLPSGLFVLDGEERVIALARQGRNSPQVSLTLLRMDRSGMVTPLGRYRFEISGLDEGKIGVVNQPPEIPYVILPHGDDLLLIHEFPLVDEEAKEVPWRAKLGLAKLRLTPEGEVIREGEMRLADLLSAGGISKEGFPQLAGMRAAEGGKGVELLLALKESRFEGGDLYLVRVDAESLRAEGKAQRLGWLCATCTASFSGRWVVVTQQASPLAKVIDPASGKGRRLVFDNLLAGSEMGLVYEDAALLPLWPPRPFGEGWAGEVHFGSSIWLRQGEKWYLTSALQQEAVVASYNSQGEFERLVRLPPRWKMARSFDPDWLLFENRFNRQFALLSRWGQVRSFEVGEGGGLRAGVIPKWLENRLRLIAYRPLDLTGYTYSWLQNRRKASLGTGPLFLIAGPDAVGVAVNLNYGRELRVKVVDYGGDPLYEVSFPRNELVDPEALRPEAADPHRYQINRWSQEFVATREGIYALVPLLWERQINWQKDGEEDSSPTAFYRVALVHISPDGKARLVSLINLEEAAERGGMVLKESLAELSGDLLTVKRGGVNPRVELYAAPTREGVKTVAELRLGNEIAAFQLRIRPKRGTVAEGSQPGIGRFAPPATVCEIELASGKLGKCAPEVPSGFDDLGDPARSSYLFPRQVSWLTDLELSSPVFFQGWTRTPEEGGATVPVINYWRGVGIRAYSGVGFLGYLSVPGRLDSLEGRLRNKEGLTYEELLCRWAEDGQLRACIRLPGRLELSALDPSGGGSFWFRIATEEWGLGALMVEPSKGRGVLHYWDGKGIAKQEFLPPYIRYLLENIAGPVEWKPLPRVVFNLHPEKEPDYSKLAQKGAN